MTKRTFPPTGNAKEEQTKIKAGYVEYPIFANEHLGYFCGTCPAFNPVYSGDRQGFCAGLKVPVWSFGCCNNWRMAPREEWIAASGRPV